MTELGAMALAWLAICGATGLVALGAVAAIGRQHARPTATRKQLDRAAADRLLWLARTEQVPALTQAFVDMGAAAGKAAEVAGSFCEAYSDFHKACAR